MILVPWVTQGQTLDTYSFSTGVDASKWITLSSPSNVFESYSDDVASSVLNIGFTFPFGDGVYSQFSVSSNGTFRLGPTATLGTTQGGMFNASYYNANLPKISGIARDMSTGSDGYVHYQLTGTAPNRVFVCEFALSYTYGNSYPGDVKWQVQLHEDSSKVVIVYAPTVPATTPSSFHIGMAETPDNIIVINPSTHDLIYSNGAHSTTYSTWPGASRYYEFVRPVITCPKPTSIAVANLGSFSFDVSWTDTSDATSWIVRLLEGDSLVYDNVENTDSVSFTGLAMKGALNLNNSIADKAEWLDYAGINDISAGEAFVLYDGRKDGREGVAGATASNEKSLGLNEVIISDDGNTKAGVTATPVNLFQSTTLTAPIYVIPVDEEITVTIDYDVETVDNNLPNLLSDGVKYGSKINNKISKTVTFGTATKFENGKSYVIKLHLGMNSVKFDADVVGWVAADEGGAWLPANQN